MIISVQRARRTIAVWLIALAVIGYPLAAVVSQIIGGDTQIVTVPYRLFIISLSLTAIIISARQAMLYRVKSLVLLFSLVYFVRLIIDYYFGHPLAQEALIYFTATCLVPLVGISFIFDPDFDEWRLRKVLAYLGVIFILCLYYFRATGSIATVHNRERLEALGPISLGHAAASICILGVVITMTSRGKAGIFGVLLASAPIPLILSSGSRGPLVAAVFALIVVLSTRFKRALYAIPAIIPALFFIDGSSIALERLQNSFSEADRAGMQRLFYQRNALYDFWESPIFGSHFLDPRLSIQSYPHNQIIETLMALGIIGALILIVIYVRMTQQYFSGLSITHPLLLGLLAQTFASVQFSGALWGNAGFLLLAYCWCALRSSRRSMARSTPTSVARLPRLQRGTF